jgi:hypothetical protein
MSGLGGHRKAGFQDALRPLWPDSGLVVFQADIALFSEAALFMRADNATCMPLRYGKFQ